MKLHFQQKLLLAFALLVLTVTFMPAVFLFGHLRSSIWKQSETSLEKQLFLIKQVVEDRWVDIRNSSSIDLFIDQLSADTGIHISLIDAAGHFVADSSFSNEELPELDNQLLRPEILEALTAGGTGRGRSIRTNAPGGKEMLYLSAILDISDRAPVIARISIPTEEIDRIVRDGQRTLFWGTVLSMFVSLLLSWSIATRFAYPVNVMTRIANKMAKRDFSEKVKITSLDEHEELAHSLNQMSQELENHIFALSNTNAELQATFRSMKEGVLVMDKRGTVLHLNQAGLAMFRLNQEPLGKGALDALRHVGLHDKIREVLRTGKPAVAEFTLNVHRPMILLCNISPMPQLDGSWGAVAVFHDVTELRRLEQMRRDFVANVSHELKTPLTSIKGFAETLLEDHGKNKDVSKKNLEIIFRQAKQLEALISDLLGLAAIESGEIRMTKKPLNIKRVFQNLLEEFAGAVSQKDLKVDIQVEPDSLQVPADDRWFKQAITNLFSNACSYTNEGDAISLSARKEHSYAVIDVRDTGIGIAERDLPRIFERFYRVDKARSRASGGTGLGLAIVKHIVEAHGGYVTATSIIGTGSTFSVRIPL